MLNEGLVTGNARAHLPPLTRTATQTDGQESDPTTFLEEPAAHTP